MSRFAPDNLQMRVAKLENEVNKLNLNHAGDEEGIPRIKTIKFDVTE